jgi:hypothetical protein
MKRALDVHPIESDFQPFEVQVKDPAAVVGILVAGVSPSILTPAQAGASPGMPIKSVPAVVFEVNPDAPTRTRKYLWLPAGQAVDVEHKIVFRHLYVEETTGHPYALYEVNPRE